MDWRLWLLLNDNRSETSLHLYRSDGSIDTPRCDKLSRGSNLTPTWPGPIWRSENKRGRNLLGSGETPFRDAECLRSSRNYVTRQRRSKYEIHIRRINSNSPSVNPRQRHHDRQSCLLHSGAHSAVSGRDDGQTRRRRNCHSRKRRELEPIGVITDCDIAWPVAATGKSPAETGVRDAVEPSVAVTPKSFYGALALESKEGKLQMKQHEVTVPQIGLIAGTRAMLGAGIVLLLSEKLSESRGEQSAGR